MLPLLRSFLFFPRDSDIFNDPAANMKHVEKSKEQSTKIVDLDGVVNA